MRPVLTHIALQVRDMAATVAFYRDFCDLAVVHTRDQGRVTWMAERGRERELVLVLLAGGHSAPQADDDYGHLGFAVDDRASVDALADRAQRSGCLVWAPRDEPYPTGYYCGVRDPDGRFVEFSYGQPLGPGAPDSAR